MKKILAIDTGGTKIIYGILNEKGEFAGEPVKKQTPKKLDELISDFQQIIEENENEVDIIAFATAGAINKTNTKVESSTPNLPDGYSSIEFSKLSKKPVYVENDANAAAWAEYKAGAAKGEDNTITITLGTGVGGGFITDGKILRGRSGRAGEVGSMKINSQGRICTCKRKDCWESYASGTGLKNTAFEIASFDEIFKSSVYSSKKPENITTYDIIAGVKMNDCYSKKVFEIWTQDIITGIINIVNIFDTESVIISGGLSEFVCIEEIEKAVNNEIVVSPVKIKRAQAGNYSGMIGAALLAVEKFRHNKNFNV